MGDGWEDVQVEDQTGSMASHGPRAGERNIGRIDGPTIQDVSSHLRAGPLETTSQTSFESKSSAELFPHHEVENRRLRQPNPESSYSTNPFHRARSTERTPPEIQNPLEESSMDIWAELVPPPSRAPPAPPTQNIVEGFGDLSLTQDNPDSHQTETEAWQHQAEDSFKETPLISFDENGQSGAETSVLPSSFVDADAAQQKYYGDQTGWTEDDYAGSSSKQATSVGQDIEPASQSYLSAGDAKQNLPILPRRPAADILPELPPRGLPEGNDPPPQPPRPPPVYVAGDANQAQSKRSTAEISQSQATRQRSETYQIKHITWMDTSGSTRTSPIMVQNANGPCPLLALVNALTLTTPRDANTALIETLRVREQVSLGLLLDAVFDELMSGRRGGAAQELPDVGELYSFLITLHTGMNVNPRFVAFASGSSDSMDVRDLNPPLSTITIGSEVGVFEETKEMNLYSTFSIPLIHGWLPSRSHPAYSAIERSARTYEDAQNLMFREEELEDKLQNHGLSQDEQLLLEDIASIKYFLSASATQLTRFGLETITRALTQGSIAILFRNDHFSTLYRHPHSGQLFTLVTDMGYAGHEEVVWESLVDVSGEGSEFFAGDFRPVGNNSNEPQYQPPDGPPPPDNQGWTKISRSKQNSKSQITAANNQSGGSSSNLRQLSIPPLERDYDLPTSPNTEQEDHDLALALQLQEEEEDRSRRETAARRREDELSQAYLDSQEPSNQRPNTGRSQVPQTIRPMVPPRGGSQAMNSLRRPPPARQADPEAGEDAPPPSYEQASKSLPYVPPTDQPFSPPSHPPSPMGPTVSSTGARPSPQGYRPRQSSAYSQNSASVGNITSPNRGSVVGRPQAGIPGRGGSSGLDGAPGIVRRRSAGVGNSNWESEDDRRDKDCVVM